MIPINIYAYHIRRNIEACYRYSEIESCMCWMERFKGLYEADDALIDMVFMLNQSIIDQIRFIHDTTDFTINLGIENSTVNG